MHSRSQVVLLIDIAAGSVRARVYKNGVLEPKRGPETPFTCKNVVREYKKGVLGYSYCGIVPFLVLRVNMIKYSPGRLQSTQFCVVCYQRSCCVRPIIIIMGIMTRLTLDLGYSDAHCTRFNAEKCPKTMFFPRQR